jgi:hypothetical protein
MSLLDKFKEASPENICQRMDQYTFKTTEYINLVNNCSELSVGQKKDICEHMENFNTFYLYVRELIEPIAYCTIDKVRLIRKDHFDNFKELIKKLQIISDSEIEQTKYRQNDAEFINHQRKSVLNDISQMELNFRHPYQ